MANIRNKKLLEQCRGPRCYLRFPCCVNWNTHASHSNALKHGRGIGMKASDEYSIPACPPCHYEYDYGKNYSREEKQGAWDRGYDQWKEDRRAAA